MTITGILVFLALLGSGVWAEFDEQKKLRRMAESWRNDNELRHTNLF